MPFAPHPGGHSARSEGMFGCHYWEGGCHAGIQWIEAWDAAECPPRNRTINSACPAQGAGPDKMEFLPSWNQLLQSPVDRTMLYSVYCAHIRGLV